MDEYIESELNQKKGEVCSVSDDGLDLLKSEYNGNFDDLQGELYRFVDKIANDASEKAQQDLNNNETQLTNGSIHSSLDKDEQSVKMDGFIESEINQVQKKDEIYSDPGRSYTPLLDLLKSEYNGNFDDLQGELYRFVGEIVNGASEKAQQNLGPCETEPIHVSIHSSLAKGDHEQPVKIDGNFESELNQLQEKGEVYPGPGRSYTELLEFLKFEYEGNVYDLQGELFQFVDEIANEAAHKVQQELATREIQLIDCISHSDGVENSPDKIKQTEEEIMLPVHILYKSPRDVDSDASVAPFTMTLSRGLVTPSEDGISIPELSEKNITDTEIDEKVTTCMDPENDTELPSNVSSSSSTITVYYDCLSTLSILNQNPSRTSSTLTCKADSVHKSLDCERNAAWMNSVPTTIYKDIAVQTEEEVEEEEEDSPFMCLINDVLAEYELEAELRRRRLDGEVKPQVDKPVTPKEVTAPRPKTQLTKSLPKPLSTKSAIVRPAKPQAINNTKCIPTGANSLASGTKSLASGTKPLASGTKPLVAKNKVVATAKLTNTKKPAWR